MNKSFRAEKSSTARHLAEFTHLEWESKFVPDLASLMDFDEDLIQTVIRQILVDCADEYSLLDQFLSKGIIARLQGYLEKDFARISYTEAIELILSEKEQLLPGLTELPK